MKCDSARELIPLCVGHEISPEEEDAVYRHLSACAECAHEMKEYRLIFSAMSRLREGAAPQGTWQTMWSNIRPEIFAGTKVVRFAFDDLLRVAAVALIGIGIGFFAILLTSEPATPTATERTGTVALVSDPIELRSLPVNRSPEAKTTGAGQRQYIFRHATKSEERFYLPSIDSVLPTKGEVKF